MNPRTLLVLTAFIEILTGLALLLAPALLSQILLGAEINDPVDFTIARVGGSAILSIGIMCWLARNGQQGPELKALTSGLLVYNITVFVPLAYSAVSFKCTLALIAALIFHGALSVFCISTLKKMGDPMESPKKNNA